jgi:hypothetical protein
MSFRIDQLTRRSAVVFALIVGASATAVAAEIEYPQIIKTRYEAVDQRAGGQFVIWSEREKIFYGLDPKLYPGARFVEVTQVTPSVGSITLTFFALAGWHSNRAIFDQDPGWHREC